MLGLQRTQGRHTAVVNINVQDGDAGRAAGRYADVGQRSFLPRRCNDRRTRRRVLTAVGRELAVRVFGTIPRWAVRLAARALIAHAPIAGEYTAVESSIGQR